MKNIYDTGGLSNILSFNHEVADNGQNVVNLFGRYFA